MKIHTGFKKIQGQRLYFISCLRETKEILVILHGWGGSSRSFTSLANYLCDMGISFYILDLPGFGKTKIFSGIKRLDDYVQVVKDFLKTVPQKKVILMGYSFGGRIAVKMASESRPSYLKGLILYAPAGIHRRSLFVKFLSAVGGILAQFVDILPAKVAFLVKRIGYRILGSYDYLYCNGLEEIFQNVIAEDLRERIKKIELPTAVLWGERDKVVPIKDAFFILKHVKGAKLFKMKGGHILHKEMPKEFNENVLKAVKSLLI